MIYVVPACMLMGVGCFVASVILLPQDRRLSRAFYALSVLWFCGAVIIVVVG